MPTAFITSNFTNNLVNLALTQVNNSGVDSNQRIWMMPVYNSWTGDLFDIAGMEGAFYRGDANQAFVDTLSKAGQLDKFGYGIATIADARCAKFQVDYLAAYERAFRARHMTVTRATMHAAARHYGHGVSGGLFGSVLANAQNILAAGYNGGDYGIGK